MKNDFVQATYFASLISEESGQLLHHQALHSRVQQVLLSIHLRSYLDSHASSSEAPSKLSRLNFVEVMSFEEQG